MAEHIVDAMNKGMAYDALAERARRAEAFIGELQSCVDVTEAPERVWKAYVAWTESKDAATAAKGGKEGQAQ